MNKKRFLSVLLEDEEFFQEIQQYMVATNWCWANFSPSYVPDTTQLKDCVKDLLNIESENCSNCATGGFRVIYNKYSLIVVFGYYDDVVLKGIAALKPIYRREISIKTLRERKLKRIIK